MPKYPVRTLTEYGKQVKIKLIELNMTQDELARQAGLNPMYLTDILYGGRAGLPAKDKINKILNIS